MQVFHRWSIAGALALLSGFAVLPLARSGDRVPAPAENCRPLHWCVTAPYTCKPGPCPPSPCFEKWCGAYCAKPMPCPPSFCQQWCKDGYCPKPPVGCFPGDPCPQCVPHKHHGKK